MLSLVGCVSMLGRLRCTQKEPVCACSCLACWAIVLALLLWFLLIYMYVTSCGSDLTHRAVRLVTLTTEGVLFLKTSIDTCSSAVMRGLASAAGVSRPAGPKQLLNVMTAAAQRLVNWAGSLSSCSFACCCRSRVPPWCWWLLPAPALTLLVLTGAAWLRSELHMTSRLRVCCCCDRT
jgi:hypothetical protein